MTDSLNNLAARIGMESISGISAYRWQEFIRREDCNAFSLALSDEDAEILDLPIESLPVLHEALALVRANPDLKRLAQFWHYLLYHLPGTTGDNPSEWPNPQVMGSCAAMFPLVALVSGLDHALRSFGELGIPDEIVRATMADVGLWVRQYHLKFGSWGLGELIWLRMHIRAWIFRVGRLQYCPGSFYWPFRVFRNKLTGEIATISEGGQVYRADGLPQGTNGIVAPDPWTSEFSKDSEWIIGSPVTALGEAVREQVRLNARKWEQMLTPGTDVLEVHIPRGGKLPVSECLESFRLAREFFREYFPEKRFAAFTCRSWMLDPNLQSIVPSESNLAQFQRLWRLVSMPGNEISAFVFVFGDRSVDLATAPRDTSLRRAILDWLTAGNHMRGAAGFVPWE